MTIQSTVGGEAIQSKWVVSHALEADAALFALAEAQFNAGVALLPHGAAAYCLTAPKDYRGHWCCQLPLSELTTGLPLMVHSFFNLSTSRKMIPVPPATPSPFRSNTQQEMWNDALLRGPVASSLAQLIMHCRNLAHCGNFLAHFFQLIELGTGQDKSAAAIRDITRSAVLQRVLKGHDIFPVIADVAKKPKLKRWLCGPSLTLGIDYSGLTEDPCDLLISMGMDLVWLPESLVKGLQAVNGSALAPLTPSDVCEFLRNHPLPADVDHGVVDELLKFVVGEGSTSDPNFECLGTCRCSDWLRKRLCPSGVSGALSIGRTCCRQGRISSSISRSSRYSSTPIQGLVRPFWALRRPLASAASNRRICSNIRRILTQWTQWRTVAGAMHSGSCCGSTRIRSTLRLLFAGFGEWRVVVVNSNSARTKPVELRTLPSTCFALHKTDADWQQDVRDILLGTGFCILDNSHVSDPNQLEMLGPHVSSGDAGFVASYTTRVSCSAPMIPALSVAS